MSIHKWYLAHSLRSLFAEVNRAAPRRRKASDGSVGDTPHLGRRSDHNPDPRAGGVVRAIDVTHDPAGGCDCNQLARSIRQRRDPRLSYIIWNRRIMSGPDGPSPWVWRRYKGANSHDHHLHVSIRHLRNAETDTRSWLGGPPIVNSRGPVVPVPAKPAYPRGGLRRGDKGEVVKWLQRRLNTLAGQAGHGALGGHLLEVDGILGANTEAVVKAFQAHRGLPASGVVGPDTWARL
jgi:hypothetical protein